ncbi:hypothetical protein JCM10296v2_000962 [Rhodotorula toruloides]
MFASHAQFDPCAFAHVATGSPSPSTASSSSSASPSLFDRPSPRSMPVSTPSPSSSSSLALPFYPDPHTGRSSSYDSAMGDFASTASSAGGMTINRSLLFGADLCAPASTDSFLPSSAPTSAGPPSPTSRSSFPSSSPPQPLPPPLFGESTTPQQRQAQVAALSSLVVVKPAPSSAGPVKRGKGAARTRSLSQGRATAAPRGRRASANDTVDDGAKSAKSWLDALKEAEIKAKLRRLQTQPHFDGPPTPGSGGRMAQLQSQLLTQSMAPQSGAGIVAQCEAPTAMLGGAAFPWVR